jgi:hypothetical protein
MDGRAPIDRSAHQPELALQRIEREKLRVERTAID